MKKLDQDQMVIIFISALLSGLTALIFQKIEVVPTNFWLNLMLSIGLYILILILIFEVLKHYFIEHPIEVDFNINSEGVLYGTFSTRPERNITLSEIRYQFATERGSETERDLIVINKDIKVSKVKKTHDIYDFSDLIRYRVTIIKFELGYIEKGFRKDLNGSVKHTTNKLNLQMII